MAQIPYRFERFTRRLLLHDMSFEGGPGPGDRFPAFDLATVDGVRLTLDEATAERPMLMVFSSFT